MTLPTTPSKPEEKPERPEQHAVVCNLASWFNMPDEPYRPYHGRRRRAPQVKTRKDRSG